MRNETTRQRYSQFTSSYYYYHIYIYNTHTILANKNSIIPERERKMETHFYLIIQV